MSALALERLRQLRLQAAPAPAAVVARPAALSAAALRALRARLDLLPALPQPPSSADGALPGVCEGPGLRRIDYPAVAAASTTLRFDRPEWQQLHCHDLLAIDCETTGLAGGTGTRAFVIGVARWQGEAIVVQQWLLTRLAGERALLQAFSAALGAAPVLLSYNGKSYDLPLLRTRCCLARVADASAGLRHLDLLHVVRRRYRGQWENCRLVTAERQLLGVLRDDDLPGSEAPAAYRRWLRDGCARDLRRVIQHNYHDLLSLCLLAQRLGTD